MPWKKILFFKSNKSLRQSKWLIEISEINKSIGVKTDERCAYPKINAEVKAPLADVQSRKNRTTDCPTVRYHSLLLGFSPVSRRIARESRRSFSSRFLNRGEQRLAVIDKWFLMRTMQFPTARSRSKAKPLLYTHSTCPLCRCVCRRSSQIAKESKVTRIDKIVAIV